MSKVIVGTVGGDLTNEDACYQWKEGIQLREGRKSTKGRKEDYQGKEGRLLKEGRKSTEERKEDDYGKDERLQREGRNITKG